MKQSIFTITSNKSLTPWVYEMKLSGDTSAFGAAGQFVNIAIPGLYLRRPISVCDYDENGLTIIYKVVGKGTKILSEMNEGENLDMLTGLGNGFEIDKLSCKPLLVGGGVGVPPMYGLCKALIEKGVRPTVVLGFNSSSEIFYEDEFLSLGAHLVVCTADGSYGIKGFVTDALAALEYDFFYACGPIPMLKALSLATSCSGLVSLEERMGCGFGACMGCTHEMLSGAKRICKDGPIFRKEEVLW